MKQKQIKTVNLQWSGLDYDHEGYYDCHFNGCDDEGICRCYTITSVTIKVTSTERIVDTYITESGINHNDFIEAYAVDRILRQYDIENKDSYEADYGPSYYGAEVHKCYHIKDQEIQHHIKQLLENKNHDEIITELLQQEYQHTKHLQNKTYRLEFHQLKTIHDKNQHKVKKQLEYSHNKQLPWGIIQPDGTIIDGHHRLFSHKPTTSKIPVLVAYDKDTTLPKLPRKTTKNILNDVLLRTNLKLKNQNYDYYDVIAEAQHRPDYDPDDLKETLLKATTTPKRKHIINYYIKHYLED